LESNRSEQTEPTFLLFKNDPSNPGCINGDDVTSITEDLDGNLWIGTKNRGFSKLVQAKDYASSPTFVQFKHDPNNPNSLRTNYIRNIYADHSGVLWIGTYNAGLNKLDPGKKQFIHYRKELNNSNSLNHNMVWSIHEDRKGILWIGTHGEELTRFDRARNEFTRYALPNRPSDVGCYDKVMSIYEDKAGILWLAAGEPGITKFDPETGQFSFQPLDSTDFQGQKCHTINFFYEDRSGTPWIGTNGGRIYEYLPLTGEFRHFSSGSREDTRLKSDKVVSMVEDQNGIMWIGAEGNGLYRFDREKEQFTNFRASLSDPNSISSDYVSFVYEDKSGIIWLGTYGGGLNKLILAGEKKNAQPTFIHYTEKHGLPNNVIYAIMEDESGNIWLSTNYGLSKFNSRKEIFTNYNVNDGLQSNEFNSGAFFKSNSGEMFFGGINGFNSFFPQNIKDNSHIPKIVITDFSLFNKSVPIIRPFGERKILQKSVSSTEEIELAYDDDAFSFEFAALHYSSPEKNQYAYKMEGFDADWIHVDSNKRFAAYTNLDPGEYVFRVRGSNNDGIWNEEGRSVTLLITPPFWEVWWFKVLVAVTLMTSVVTWYKRRTAKIR
jgi:ligand-binding sensor domain-containing protein